MTDNRKQLAELIEQNKIALAEIREREKQFRELYGDEFEHLELPYDLEDRIAATENKIMAALAASGKNGNNSQ